MEREEALPNGHGGHGTSGAGTAGRQQVNGKTGGSAASKKRKPGECLEGYSSVGIMAATVGMVVTDYWGMGADYDEEDDGFLFTRTRSKRAKAAAALPPPEPIAEEREEPVPVPAKSRRKRQSDTPSAPDKEDHRLKVKKKRSTRNSGEKVVVEEDKATGRRRVEERDDGGSSHARSKEQPRAAQRGGEAEDSIDLVGRVSHVGRSRDVTKIALPFADTPVIRRNKEMRKGADTGHRRSSLGMRGRRASSLIDGGKSNGRLPYSNLMEDVGLVADGYEALPHDEVEIAEFYKHIESDGLPEPRRMKQLLTWCGTRAMGEKPSYSSEDSNARLAGKPRTCVARVTFTNVFSTSHTRRAAQRLFDSVRNVRLVQ